MYFKVTVSIYKIKYFFKFQSKKKNFFFGCEVCWRTAFQNKQNSKNKQSAEKSLSRKQKIKELSGILYKIKES